MSFNTKHNKVEVARVQLTSAIEAYREDRYIEALTLAGASEGILGAMCQRKGVQTSVEKIADLPQLLEIFPVKTDRIDFLNRARNCLKHASDSTEDDFEIAEEDAFFMIVRAIGNLTTLGISETNVIREFWLKHQNQKPL